MIIYNKKFHQTLEQNMAPAVKQSLLEEIVEQFYATIEEIFKKNYFNLKLSFYKEDGWPYQDIILDYKTTKQKQKAFFKKYFFTYLKNPFGPYKNAEILTKEYKSLMEQEFKEFKELLLHDDKYEDFLLENFNLFRYRKKEVKLQYNIPFKTEEKTESGILHVSNFVQPSFFILPNLLEINVVDSIDVSLSFSDNEEDYKKPDLVAFVGETRNSKLFAREREDFIPKGYTTSKNKIKNAIKELDFASNPDPVIAISMKINYKCENRYEVGLLKSFLVKNGIFASEVDQKQLCALRKLDLFSLFTI